VMISTNVPLEIERESKHGAPSKFRPRVFLDENKSCTRFQKF